MKNQKHYIWVIAIFLCVFTSSILFDGFTTIVAAQEVKIGVVYSTGGPGGRLGGELLLTTRLAAKYYNEEKGGLTIGGKKYKITLIEYNSNTSPQEGVSVVKRLIESDKVPMIIGDCISGVIIAQQPVIEKAKWPWIMAGSAANLTTEGFKYSNRCNMTDAVVAKDYWQGVLASMPSDKKKLAIFGIATEYGKSKIKQARTFATRNGAKIIFDETFSFKTSDFYPVLTKFKKIKPDMVYMPNYGELATIMKQAKEVGFNATWVTDDTIEPSLLAKMAGDLVLGLNIFTTNDPFLDSIDAKIYRKYIVAEKGPLSIYAGSYALGWDTAIRAFKALEKANTLTDTAKICKAIKEVVWDGVSTQGKFDETGQIGVSGKVLRIIKNDGTSKVLSRAGRLMD